MKIGNKTYDTKNHTYVMGILNVTPDSFSDGGKYLKEDLALKQVERMIDEGADIVDVGGESSRPGYIKVTEEEEIQRVIPIIEKIKRRFNIPISLDTYRSKVAKEGIIAGADMINDIWGLQYDDKIASVISEAKVACCLMHNRNPNPCYQKGETGQTVLYENFLEEISSDLYKSINKARIAGIDHEKIIIDPGIGFAKNLEENLLAIKHIKKLCGMEFPVLLAASRKSVIGLTLGLSSSERIEGTLATTAYAVMSGCSFVRVHDVKENKRCIQMLEAIIQAN